VLGGCIKSIGASVQDATDAIAAGADDGAANLYDNAYPSS
jgi:hypothetical protein